MADSIVRCPSCDGYGWLTDDFTGESGDCDWCAGTGYVYRSPDATDRPIPPADYGRVAAQLESLEHDRLRDMGYSGSALHPDDQPIRRRSADDTEDLP